MKSALFLLCTAFALPALPSPVTYDIAFQGGFFINQPPYFVSDAPESGSFTYDPVSGFASFSVLWGIDTFDLTASANANPLAEFTYLTTQDRWSATEIGGCCNIRSTALGIGSAFVVEPNFPSGAPFNGAIAIIGTYAVSQTPEPGTLRTLSIALLSLLCFSRSRLRRR